MSRLVNQDSLDALPQGAQLPLRQTLAERLLEVGYEFLRLRDDGDDLRLWSTQRIHFLQPAFQMLPLVDKFQQAPIGRLTVGGRDADQQDVNRSIDTSQFLFGPAHRGLELIGHSEVLQPQNTDLRGRRSR